MMYNASCVFEVVQAFFWLEEVADVAKGIDKGVECACADVLEMGFDLGEGPAPRTATKTTSRLLPVVKTPTYAKATPRRATDARVRTVATRRRPSKSGASLRADSAILIDSEGRPVGDKWSFNEERRSKIAAKALPLPDTAPFNSSTVAAAEWESGLNVGLYGKAVCCTPMQVRANTCTISLPPDSTISAPTRT